MAKTLIVVVGLVAAGAVGALTATLVGRGPAADPAGGDPSRVLARLDEIEAQVERNRRAIADLEVPPPLPDAAAEAERGPDAPEPPDPDADPVERRKELEAKVLEAVEKNRAAEREAMGKRFSAMAARRETAMIGRLKESAGLTPYQEEELSKLLARRRQAIGEFFRTMFSQSGDTDFEAIQKKVADVRKETDDEIKALLSPDQYEKFTEEESQNRRGPWFLGGERTSER